MLQNGCRKSPPDLIMTTFGYSNRLLLHPGISFPHQTLGLPQVGAQAGGQRQSVPAAPPYCPTLPSRLPHPPRKADLWLSGKRGEGEVLRLHTDMPSLWFQPEHCKSISSLSELTRTPGLLWPTLGSPINFTLCTCWFRVPSIRLLYRHLSQRHFIYVHSSLCRSCVS